MEPGLAFYQERMDMKAPKSIIQRITASNGSVFTGPGTNSYLIGTDDITLVDPGPKIDAHLSNLFCLLYTSPSPRDATLSRMPSSA